MLIMGGGWRATSSMPLRARSCVRSTSRLMARATSSPGSPAGLIVCPPARARRRPPRDEAPTVPVAPRPVDVEARVCPRATEGLRGAGPRREAFDGAGDGAHRAVHRWLAICKSDELVSDLSGGPTCRSTPSKARPPRWRVGHGHHLTPRCASWRKERADVAVGEGRRVRTPRCGLDEARVGPRGSPCGHFSMPSWRHGSRAPKKSAIVAAGTGRGVVQEVVAPALDDVQPRVAAGRPPRPPSSPWASSCRRCPDITNVGWVTRCSQGRLWKAENAVICSV